MSALRHVGSAAFLIASVVFTLPAWSAGGAYLVDDAAVGQPGECKVEGWGSFAGSGDRVFHAGSACTFEALPRFEWQINGERGRADGAWTSAAGGQVKAVLIPDERSGALGLSGGAGHNVTTGRAEGGSVTVLGTVAPAEGLRLNANIGWQHDAVEQTHDLFLGAGAEWTVAERMVLIAEAFGNADGPPGWQAGPRLLLLDYLDLDLVAGRNITGAPAYWFTAGATLRF